ncbi:MAG: RNB domain-containing ribonuclease [Rickettsiales bacterium]
MQASESLGFVDVNDTSRRRIVTHAIDNVGPEIQADRDDGIYADASPSGDGYIIETTTAAVADYVPLKNVLSHVAHDRAFTVYRPDMRMNDPMFPKPLEDRMSLEHQQPRYGQTTYTERDAKLNVAYLEFQRTLTVSDNSDYAMAEKRMHSDPRFMLMREVAHLMGQRLKHSSPEAYREMKEIQDKTGLYGSRLEATEVVKHYMLDDNEQKATFMERAKLPFIYRNFENDAKDEDGISRAYYSTRRKKHDALARDGLTGAYAHCTSPIRRGADYFNAHMVNYVIDGVDSLENDLHVAFPQLGREQLHRGLWLQAPELFALQHNPPMRVARVIADKLVTSLGVEMNEGLLGICQRFAERNPPLSVSQLDRYCRQINVLNGHEQRNLKDPALKRWMMDEEERLQVSQKIAGLRPEEWALKDAIAFTSILRNAAKYGVMNEGLKEETIRRLKAPKTMNMSKDAMTILLIADPNHPDWHDLKKIVCRIVKRLPGTVNGVLELAQAEGYLPKESFNWVSRSLPVKRDQLSLIPESIEAALLTYRSKDGTLIAAPYYSVGHDERSALSHACYYFLENYAFGDLRPINQSAIPDLLYAELDHPHADKRKLVEEMVAKKGATLIMVEYDNLGLKNVRAIVKGGELLAPIIASASAEDGTEIESIALKRLLSTPLFKSAFTFSNLAGMGMLVKPYALLQEKLADAGMKHEIQTAEKRLHGGNVQFVTTIMINGQRFQGDHWPNKDRALHDVAIKVLRHYGWLPEVPLLAGSWVTSRDEIETASRQSSAVL